MCYVKTIVCLANSTKNSGRCIAGIEIKNKQFAGWIRPVSDRPGHEISEEERRFKNGKKCSVLDVVKVPLDRHEPYLHQNENHVINEDYYWEKVGGMSVADLSSAVQEFEKPIWPHCESTQNGCNDRISKNRLANIHTSLALIQPKDACIVVSTDPGFKDAPGRRAVRADFICGGEKNFLKITDPNVVSKYMGKGEGKYPVKKPLLTVSLAEPWSKQPYAFKVVASVLMP